LLIALDNIDEVIQIIRSSANTQEAKDRLIARFGLTDVQAQAIVDMRLRALTGLEREKLEQEHAELVKKIEEYKAILADKKLLLGVIRDEISVISDKYGDDRRTKFGHDESDIEDEDLIPRGNTVIAMTSLGYIKRMTVDNFKTQNRGGRGIKGMATIEDDYIEDLLMTSTHNYLMFFTNLGRVYRLKAYEIPEAGRTARGTAIVNLLQLNPGEKISAMIPVKEFEDGKHLFMITKKGIAKKTSLIEFENVRKNGLAAISLKDDDELIEVKITDENSIIALVTKYGMCIRFKETDVRCMGRTAMGVIGMNLDDGDEIVGMQIDTQGSHLLIASEMGMGKRTLVSEFGIQKRGGKGVKCYKITEKTGNVVGVKAVNEDNEVMMITTEGVIIQIAVGGISVYGRNTSGVKLINLDDGVTVAKIAKVREKIVDSPAEGEDVEELDVDVSDETESEIEDDADGDEDLE
jgi:DNA gyrase subunit A